MAAVASDRPHGRAALLFAAGSGAVLLIALARLVVVRTPSWLGACSGCWSRPSCCCWVARRSPAPSRRPRPLAVPVRDLHADADAHADDRRRRPPRSATPVAGATLRWGVNNESSNRAFAPGTFNFFSAGVLPDPGRGGVQITQAQWQQSAGAVVGRRSGTARPGGPATWAGLSTDSSGAPLGTPTAGTFSNHTFVFAGGTGTVDARGRHRPRRPGTAT